MASLAAVSTIKLNLKHVGLGMEFSELRFQNDISLAQLKDKLYPKTGTEPRHMLLTKNGQELGDEGSSLRALHLEDGDNLEMVSDGIFFLLIAVALTSCPVYKSEPHASLI